METQGRIVPAAGMFKTEEDVKRALDLPISEIYLGSITWDEKEGNKGTTFDADGAGNFWNAIGLKNGGAAYYRMHLPEIFKMVKDAGRSLVVSISGNTAEENGKLAALAAPYCHVIELNTACPNIVTEGGGRKPLIGFSAEATCKHLHQVATAIGKRAGLRVKVPPYNDLELLGEVARVLAENATLYGISGIVATNTMPGCVPLDDESNDSINVGYAGGSGLQLHSSAIGNVRKWRTTLPPTIDVYGAGGAQTAHNVRNFERQGVKGCQIAGAFYQDPKALQDVLIGL